MGAGPMTGRAAGFCAGNTAPGYANFGGGGGRGFGRGFGRGWGWPVAGVGAPPTGDQELAVLKQQAQQLKADMDLIQGRIQELETKPDKA